MFPKFEILMLLAIIIPESLSGPTNATGPLVIGSRSEDLKKELARMNMSMHQFKDLVEYSEFELGWSMDFFIPTLLKNVLKDPKNDKKNVAISPLSIQFAMMMLYLASPIGSTTHKQITEALGLRDENIPTYLGNSWGMLNYFDEHDTGLSMANGIFIKGGFPIRQDYMTRLHAFFGTIPKNLDHIPSIAVRDINEFVSNNTNGLIPNLLQPGAIDLKLTKVVLVNALHHKGKWLIEFDKDQTAEMDFTLVDGTEVKVEKGMYVKSRYLRFAEADRFGKKYVVLELPYQKGFKMYVTLPAENTRDDVNEAALIDPVDLEEADEFACDRNGLVVKMPGFKIEYETSLVETLQKMGLTDMFALHMANFDEMTEQGVAITEFQTKIKVVVDEEGSDSAAATAATFCTRDKTKPTELKLNRPFSYRIIEEKYRATVLAGIVLDPREQKSP